MPDGRTQTESLHPGRVIADVLGNSQNKRFEIEKRTSASRACIEKQHSCFSLGVCTLLQGTIQRSCKQNRVVRSALDFALMITMTRLLRGFVQIHHTNDLLHGPAMRICGSVLDSPDHHEVWNYEDRRNGKAHHDFVLEEAIICQDSVSRLPHPPPTRKTNKTSYAEISPAPVSMIESQIEGLESQIVARHSFPV